MSDTFYRYNFLAIRAQELASEYRYEEAADTYFVAADLAEELGEPERARFARMHARACLVVVWAKKRWPTSSITKNHIRPCPTRSPRDEIVRFLIRFDRPIHVRIDRRGRIRRMTPSERADGR